MSLPEMADAPAFIPISTPEGAYPVYLEHGALESLPALLVRHGLNGRAVLVSNTTVGPLHGEALAKRLNVPLICVPDGEQYKTLDTVRTLYDAFIEAGLDRQATIIALSGGVVGDMAGFAAATYLRGVRFVQIPTSLLAMVDSSVGGKVGVDVPQGKNLIGAFKQPEFVLIDPSVLRTLPDVEWRCGVAEVIKAGLLRDPALLNPDLYGRNTPDGGAGFIRRAVEIKAGVVEEDPFEAGLRAILNLGHTFGHAVEQASGYTWRHGEGVGFGLVAAARLSALIGLCNPQLPDMVEALVRAVGLPARLGDLPVAKIVGFMGTDKKRQGGKVRFVLLRGIGDPLVTGDVLPEYVIQVLNELR